MKRLAKTSGFSIGEINLGDGSRQRCHTSGNSRPALAGAREGSVANGEVRPTGGACCSEILHSIVENEVRFAPGRLTLQVRIGVNVSGRSACLLSDTESTEHSIENVVGVHSTKHGCQVIESCAKFTGHEFVASCEL